MDIHHVGVQMRGGPEFSVGNEFVLGRAVFCVLMRLLYLSKAMCCAQVASVEH